MGTDSRKHASAPLTHPNSPGQPHLRPGGQQRPADMAPTGLKDCNSQHPGRGAPYSVHHFQALEESSQASHQPPLMLGFRTSDWLGPARGLLTDPFRTRPALSPAASRKPLAGGKELAAATVHTFFPASHVNSPLSRRYYLTRAAADDNRAASTLLTQDPPLLLPAPGSPPTLCTNLAAQARHGFPRPPSSTGFELLPGVREAQGRRPSPCRPVRPASGPRVTRFSFPPTVLRRESPASGQVHLVH